MENETSLFEFDEDTGTVVYEPADIPETVPDEVLEVPAENSSVESEVVEDVQSDSISDPSDSEGQLLPSEEENPPELVEGQEETGGDVVLSANTVIFSDSDSNVMLLSDDLSSSLVLATPAEGSMSSSTLQYFDRVVSGLGSDYEYVAYRTDADDAYSGQLVFGRDFDFEDGVISFGSKATAIDVYRLSGSYGSVVNYDKYDCSGNSVTISDSGNVVYYTNVSEGFPVLGGYAENVPLSPLIVVGLICAMASAVINKLLNRRV